MFILRQFGAKLAPDAQTAIGGAVTYPYRQVDVPRRMILKIDAGKFTSDSIFLNSTDIEVLPLPIAYTSAKRLYCAIKASEICKVTIVSPNHGTSNFLIRGSVGSPEGNHDGYLIWDGTVTSITITMAPDADAEALIEYFFFELPDLTIPASYRDGNRALGVVATP